MFAPHFPHSCCSTPTSSCCGPASCSTSIMSSTCPARVPSRLLMKPGAKHVGEEEYVSRKKLTAAHSAKDVAHSAGDFICQTNAQSSFWNPAILQFSLDPFEIEILTDHWFLKVPTSHDSHSSQIPNPNFSMMSRSQVIANRRIGFSRDHVDLNEGGQEEQIGHSEVHDDLSSRRQEGNMGFSSDREDKGQGDADRGGDNRLGKEEHAGQEQEECQVQEADARRSRRSRAHGPRPRRPRKPTTTTDAHTHTTSKRRQHPTTTSQPQRPRPRLDVM